MSQLLERILSRENMFTALAKVKANKGAGGVDGISTEGLVSQGKLGGNPKQNPKKNI